MVMNNFFFFKINEAVVFLQASTSERGVVIIDSFQTRRRSGLELATCECEDKSRRKKVMILGRLLTLR